MRICGENVLVLSRGGGEKEAERGGMEAWSELCNSAAASVMSAAASPTGGDAPLKGGRWGRGATARLRSSLRIF